MTEQHLIDLGFERVDVTAKDSGYEKDWYYYALDLGKQRVISLISPANNEIKDNVWYVEILEDGFIRFDNIKELKAFIKIVKDNTISK